MMRGVLHLKPALISIKSDPRDREKENPLVALIPDELEFNLIKKIVPLLITFETSSELLSGDHYPTICSVVPRLYLMRCQMFSVKTVQTALPKFAPVREMVSAMYDDMVARFHEYGCHVDAYAFGNLLHPKYRNSLLCEHFLSKSTVESTGTT